MLHEFLNNVLHNMFKPLLLFFYAGFLVPLLGVKIEFPKAAYQALTIYLLLAIGWHGGEELASLEPEMYGQALGFMFVGFLTNLVIGIVAYQLLRAFTTLRKVDAATVAGYYGSDSAGTFVTCLGVLTAAQVAFAPYMPVMLAVMEIPGCLVALFLVSRMRNHGMDAQGNMPGEVGYRAHHKQQHLAHSELDETVDDVTVTARHNGHQAVHSQYGSGTATAVATRTTRKQGHHHGGGDDYRPGDSDPVMETYEEEEAHKAEERIAIQRVPPAEDPSLEHKPKSWLNRELLHEVFLNPGIFLLFAGIAIGFISRLQGEKVTSAGDALFNTLFQGCLCLFLLEMGISACSKLKDLRVAGWKFVAFGLLAPNLFAITGICVAHCYSLFLGQPFDLGTYVLFAVLCGAASYIAVPAVQRLAIPEASPTLPLAASLGLTFSYNVTLGIPLYMMIAESIMKLAPVYHAAA
ncbi:sodium-dependent bicarbonate transport family permease [bacterium]|nr:sodium-dependent bicarbonate transport family permease [bacterium]